VARSNGITPTSTFRLPARTLRELAELAEHLAGARGGRPNRTAVLVEAVREMHEKNLGKISKKTGKNT
jgi:hypothetical protein